MTLVLLVQRDFQEMLALQELQVCLDHRVKQDQEEMSDKQDRLDLEACLDLMETQELLGLLDQEEILAHLVQLGLKDHLELQDLLDLKVLKVPREAMATLEHQAHPGPQEFRGLLVQQVELDFLDLLDQLDQLDL